MVEQTSAARQTLAHESEEVARLISRFKLGASARVQSQIATRQPVRAARPSSSAPKKIVCASGGGRAAVAALPAPYSAAVLSVAGGAATVRDSSKCGRSVTKSATCMQRPWKKAPASIESC